jgi:hypothetical protein
MDLTISPAALILLSKGIQQHLLELLRDDVMKRSYHLRKDISSRKLIQRIQRETHLSENKNNFDYHPTTIMKSPAKLPNRRSISMVEISPSYKFHSPNMKMESVPSSSPMKGSSVSSLFLPKRTVPSPQKPKYPSKNDLKEKPQVQIRFGPDVAKFLARENEDDGDEESLGKEEEQPRQAAFIDSSPNEITFQDVLSGISFFYEGLNPFQSIRDFMGKKRITNG